MHSQVGEASFFDYHPIVEAHVRVYAVLHEEAKQRVHRLPESAGPISPGTHKSDEELSECSEGGVACCGGGNRTDSPPRDSKESQGTTSSAAGPSYERAFFQTRVMRLTNPNDELGGMLFLATPQQISHRIDRWSPLFPPSGFARHTAAEKAEEKLATQKVAEEYTAGRKLSKRLKVQCPTFPGLVLREDDVDANEMIETEIGVRRQVAEEIAEERARAEASTEARGRGSLAEASAYPGGARPRQGALADDASLREMRDEIQRHLDECELEIIELNEGPPSPSHTLPHLLTPSLRFLQVRARDHRARRGHRPLLEQHLPGAPLVHDERHRLRQGLRADDERAARRPAAPRVGELPLARRGRLQRAHGQQLALVRRRPRARRLRSFVPQNSARAADGPGRRARRPSSTPSERRRSSARGGACAKMSEREKRSERPHAPSRQHRVESVYSCIDTAVHRLHSRERRLELRGRVSESTV